MITSFNSSIERVVFVSEVRSRTGVVNVFEGACSDCIEISKYFVCLPMKNLKRKMVFVQSKIIIIFCINIIINAY